MSVVNFDATNAEGDILYEKIQNKQCSNFTAYFCFFLLLQKYKMNKTSIQSIKVFNI